jgi:hypothetical protein
MAAARQDHFQTPLERYCSRALFVIAAKSWLGSRNGFSVLSGSLLRSQRLEHLLSAATNLDSYRFGTDRRRNFGPPTAGARVSGALSQTGHIDMKSMELWLLCEEEVTYRQGPTFAKAPHRLSAAVAF